MIRKVLTLFVLLASLGAIDNASAQSGGAAYAPINPNTGAVQGYYSGRLRGYFQLRNFHLPQYGGFVAVRIASLDSDSPLREIGLRPGDVVTRLDGIAISNLSELERHAYDTTVRFIRAGTQYVQSAEVYIPFRYAVGYPPGSEAP